MYKRKLATAICGTLIGATLWGTTVFADQTYKVKSGDTLWGISFKHGVTVSDLKSWNNLNTDLIFVGQQLTVGKDSDNENQSHSSPAPEKEEKPTEKKPEPTNTTNTYTVQYGDSLWAIATKHGMTVSSLKSLNNLTSNVIFPGQRLHINGQAPSSSPATGNDEPSEDPADPGASDITLIEEAKKYLGSPYQWAGTSPAGFDCSGYLNYVFAQVGEAIPRTVASIYAYDRFVHVSSVNRQPGDVVFFETYKPGASHAGIFIGNGQFIHSGSSAGVVISSLSSNYWNDRYIGTKRLTD